MKIPTKEEALARPENLCDMGKRAYEVVMAVLTKYDVDPGGCQTFHAPGAWQAKRDVRLDKSSVLIVAYDGGEVSGFFNEDLDFPGGKLSTEMHEALRTAGLYAEECTSWYSVILPAQRMDRDP